MMWYAMLVAVALAEPPLEVTEDNLPPERPEAAVSVDGECPDPVGLVKGKKLPPGLLDANGIVKCSAVALPNSVYVDLENDRSWAFQLSKRYKYDMGAQAFRYRALEIELDWANRRIVQLETPPPWTDRPGVQRWAGRVETLASVVVVGFVVVNVDKLKL